MTAAQGDAVLTAGLAPALAAAGPAEVAAATFEADFRPELLATTEEVEPALEADERLVDARPAPQYEGEARHPAARSAGTIPGAASLEELPAGAGGHRAVRRPRARAGAGERGRDPYR